MKPKKRKKIVAWAYADETGMGIYETRQTPKIPGEREYKLVEHDAKRERLIKRIKCEYEYGEMEDVCAACLDLINYEKETK